MQWRSSTTPASCLQATCEFSARSSRLMACVSRNRGAGVTSPHHASLLLGARCCLFNAAGHVHRMPHAALHNTLQGLPQPSDTCMSPAAVSTQIPRKNKARISQEGGSRGRPNAGLSQGRGGGGARPSPAAGQAARPPPEVPIDTLPLVNHHCRCQMLLHPGRCVTACGRRLSLRGVTQQAAHLLQEQALGCACAMVAQRFKFRSLC